jgi:ribosome-associated protein
MSDLRVNEWLVIPAWELWYTTSRSSGAGGQHVNTTNSKVTLYWVPSRSSVVSDFQKSRICRRLANRINLEGELQVHVESERSQLRNLEEAREKLADWIAKALYVAPARIPTNTPKWAKKERVNDKKARGEVKSLRKSPSGRDEG